MGNNIVEHTLNKVVFLDRDGTLNEEVNYLHKPEDMKLLPGVPQALKKLKDAGINMEESEVQDSENKIFSGKTFVLTGTLSEYTRDEASEIIERLGGKTSSSVSKKTSYLLAGENAGSKYDKATALGINIITEKEFKNMIE